MEIFSSGLDATRARRCGAGHSRGRSAPPCAPRTLSPRSLPALPLSWIAWPGANPAPTPRRLSPHVCASCTSSAGSASCLPYETRRSCRCSARCFSPSQNSRCSRLRRCCGLTLYEGSRHGRGGSTTGPRQTLRRPPGAASWKVLWTTGGAGARQWALKMSLYAASLSLKCKAQQPVPVSLTCVVAVDASSGAPPSAGCEKPSSPRSCGAAACGISAGEGRRAQSELAGGSAPMAAQVAQSSGRGANSGTRGTLL